MRGRMWCRRTMGRMSWIFCLECAYASGRACCILHTTYYILNCTVPAHCTVHNDSRRVCDPIYRFVLSGQAQLTGAGSQASRALACPSRGITPQDDRISFHWMEASRIVPAQRLSERH
ncbi:hypothetical protein DFH08DRAFT_856437 [Mycena albidolilacea]|uniref:Secreted protein n=1 Tax=Mycena albidolilacea TaxID=1033008 RepID=A0AAD7AA56_9AGAR|nr:hypothetical protein DFH08DRAFT_856437 [Mycena albidolilacea]